MDGVRAEQKCYSQVTEEQRGQNEKRFSQAHSTLPYFAPHGGLNSHSVDTERTTDHRTSLADFGGVGNILVV